jgi:hypothetical protein
MRRRSGFGFSDQAALLLVAGIVGGEGRVDVIELLPLGGDLVLKGEDGAKALAIGRKTLGGVGGHPLLFDEFHLRSVTRQYSRREISPSAETSNPYSISVDRPVRCIVSSMRAIFVPRGAMAVTNSSKPPIVPNRHSPALASNSRWRIALRSAAPASLRSTKVLPSTFMVKRSPRVWVRCCNVLFDLRDTAGRGGKTAFRVMDRAADCILVVKMGVS